VTSLAERFFAADCQELLACALARMLYNAATSSSYVWAEVLSRDCIVRHDFRSARALASWLVDKDALTSPSSSCAVISFVCSLIMTRGLEALRSDMDCSSSPLIGLFGHCSQELTNLCLAGRAVTNVFDGDVCFEDGADLTVLHGVNKAPPVGFLTALEPLRLCEVGQYLKRPEYPLWVVGSASHYSLIFTEDCQLNHHVIGGSNSGGGARSSHACSACSALSSPAGGTASRLWHLNGRADFGSEGPTLRLVGIQLPSTSPACYTPLATLSGDQDTRLFAEVVRSRWPGAEVSYPQVGTASGLAGPPRLI